MASVTYTCNSCGNFWYKGNGEKCPECGSFSVDTDWDEQYDFKRDFSDVRDCYDELSDTEDHREVLMGVFGQ